ncbi:MAG: DUF805 domain-containing protein [Candidatus Poribacteria bacterium]|nr:DUF805 domain-containing protein [Candidatus Poribacteria bacterium]MDE0502993.1 DUF805 domain-containing protein [Candidatus Poribacteria bacterium]
MKLSNIDLNSPKTRQGMNRLWMVLTGITSIIVSIVVGIQDSDNWFAALLITAAVMYPAGLVLYWAAHWIIQGFRTSPAPSKPPPNSPPPSPPHSQSHQAKPEKTRIGRLTFLKYSLLIFFGHAIVNYLGSAFIESYVQVEKIEDASLILDLLIYILFVVVMINPTIRRLHDVNKSGGWRWLLLVPLVNLIFIIVLCCVRGSPGENRYGMPQSNHKASQTSSEPAGATPPPTSPNNGKRERWFLCGWNFIWGGRRGSSRWLMVIVAVIVFTTIICIIIPWKVSVQINAKPYAEVFIKPPWSGSYVQPEPPNPLITPDTRKAWRGTDIKLVHNKTEVVFPYETRYVRDGVWVISHDFSKE